MGSTWLQRKILPCDLSDSSVTVGEISQNFDWLAISSNATQTIICFDLDMDFLLDNNMITAAIVIINKLMHLVKFYYATVIDCEQTFNQRAMFVQVVCFFIFVNKFF